MSDLIERQVAIETVVKMRDRCTTGNMDDYRDLLVESLSVLPTADTDMSEYSDRLWKLAYERGKTEGIVRCKDCVFSQGFAWYACPMAGKVNPKNNDFCSRGERRADG